MISDHCRIDKHGRGREQALAETEKVAAYCGLAQKDALRLRLLTEELVGMMQGIAGDYTADFRLEAVDGLFTLFLTADVCLDWDAKEELIALASSGRNKAAEGVMGKIAVLFETYVIGEQNVPIPFPQPSYFMMDAGDMDMTAFWSMQAYRSELAQNRSTRAQEWDELEKSIVANLADEITVAVRSKWVEIQVSKRFQ